jgi:hypothetical protein
MSFLDDVYKNQGQPAPSSPATPSGQSGGSFLDSIYQSSKPTDKPTTPVKKEEKKKGVARRAFDFLFKPRAAKEGSQVFKVGEGLTPSQKVTAESIVRKPSNLPERSNIVVDTARGISRAVASPAVSVFTGGKGTSYQPKSRVATAILGEDEVKSPGRRIEEAGTTIGRIRGEKQPGLGSLALGALGVAGSTVIDTSIEGAGGGVGKKVAKGIIKEVEEKYGKRVAESVVKSVAEEVAQATAKKGAEREAVFKAIREKYVAGKGNFVPELYVAEQTAKREAARRGPISTVKEKAKNLYQEAKLKLVDSNAPIEDVLRTAEKKGKFQVLPERNITNAIDRTLRAPTLAGQFARDNGLETVIKGVDNLDNLEQYMVAKQSLAVEGRGIKTGRDLKKDTQLISAFAPRYEETAQKVTEYSHKLLDYVTDSGLISREAAETLKERYPDYVPLNRIFNELEKIQMARARGQAVASLSKQNVIQALEGSEREVESPIASLLAKTNDAFSQGEKNKAAQILESYKDLPDNPFKIRFLPDGEKAEAGMGTFSVLKNGVKETYETTADIAQAAKALSVQQLNILGKILAAPVRIAKVGITGINLPFVGANVVRDQLFTAITSREALKTSLANPVMFVKSLFSALKHDELYERLVRAGAGGTSFDISRNQAIGTISKLRSERSLASKIKYTARHPSELLRSIEDVVGRSEELTRLTQFKGTEDALIKKGVSPARAEILAAQAARENSANFYRRGEWGTVMNSAILYLNASIQGSRAFTRALSRNPVKTSAKVATVLFTPMAIMTAWNLSDPDRKAAYEDIAEYEKENNFIIVPPNPEKDENGKWNIIKIPLPAGVGKLTIPVRRSLEQAHGLDPVKFNEIAKSLIGTFSPVEPDTGSIVSTITPQAIKPTIEAVTNRNLFTGIPQVPESMKELSPELQAKEKTSGTARKVAALLKASPIKVEEFIKGTFGGVGSQVLNASDYVLAGLDIIPKDQIGGQNIAEAILARFSKATGGELDRKSAGELRNLIRNQADEDFRKKQEAEILNDELKSLSKEEANQRVKEISEANPQLYDKLVDVVQEEKLGLTYNDRLIKRLAVDTGDRARFIFQTLQGFATREEKNAYIQDLIDKKIISNEVMEQLRRLKDGA